MKGSTVIDKLFKQLWQGYIEINPIGEEIFQGLNTFNTFSNDHIALRTFDHPKTSIHTLASEFISLGYVPQDSYHFANKHLKAQYFSHPQGHPKVFISAFDIDSLSLVNQAIVMQCIQHVPDQAGNGLVYSGRHWEVFHEDYLSLREESEYAAWLYVFGFMANHFTVNVNDLAHFDTELVKVNQWLKDQGFSLNHLGGEIKGSKAEMLEQSSTQASKIAIGFSDGVFHIPGCYYEFAKRYPDKNGTLFQGFVTRSADKIFESTH